MKNTDHRLSIFFMIIVLSFAAFACLDTAPVPPTADSAGTAQALKVTEQALSFQATEKALSATQGAIEAQAAAPVVQLQPTNASTTVVFTVINKSSITICRTFFSPTTNPEWVASEAINITIKPNYYQTFTVVPGDYDLRVEDCENNLIAEHYDVSIPTYTSWSITQDSRMSSSSEPLCGNGVCGDFENSGNCPQDCGSYTATCGNGYCEAGEDAINCGYDCGFCPDSYCTGFENPQNCPQDCGGGSEPLCGNGVCGDFENPGNCPQDCGSSSAECGNGYCEAGEDAINCGYDCGFCPDGYCTGFENPQNCPQDCK